MSRLSVWKQDFASAKDTGTLLPIGLLVLLIGPSDRLTLTAVRGLLIHEKPGVVSFVSRHVDHAIQD